MDHTQNTAPFFIDLVQLVRCLLLKNADDMDQEGELHLGFGPESEGVRFFAGAEQAQAFVKDFDLGDHALLKELTINPLLRSLDLAVMPLRLLPRSPVTAAFAPEGTEVPASTPYGRLVASPLLLRLLNMPLMRICEFQTYVATEVRSGRNTRGQPIVFSDDPDYVIWQHPFVPPRGMEDEHYNMMRMIGGQVISEIFRHDVSRLRHDTALTPTLCAWWSRARHLAGIDRHETHDALTEIRSADSERYSVHLGGPHWAVNSKLLVDQRLGSWTSTSGSDPTEILMNRLCTLRVEDVYYNHLAGHLFDEAGNALNHMSDRDEAGRYVASANDVSLPTEVTVDLCYSKFFPAFISKPVGLYGREGNERIKRLSRHPPFATCRVGRWSVPKYRVDSIDELREVLSGVIAGATGTLQTEGTRKLLFRGQTRHYSTEREAGVLQFFYGSPDVDELSLVASAVRHSFDIESFLPRFQLQIQGILYARLDRSHFNKARFDSDEKPGVNKSISVLPFADEEIWSRYRIWRRMFGEAEWDLLVMGLAQHYGIPTLGLDVTDHLGVARWFAWNAATDGQTLEGTPRYKPLSSVDVRDTKPVIYLLLVDTKMRHYLRPMEREVSLDATRVFRQQAFLHYGASYLRQNRCAEDVVAIIELGDWSRPQAPETDAVVPRWYEYSTYREMSTTATRLKNSAEEMVNDVYMRDWADFDQQVGSDSLFPGPAEDLVLGQLLDLKIRALKEGIIEGYEHLS